MPLFSVITITFNNRDGLRRTSSSILSQTCKDFEWIIIDGNSTDGTQADFINYQSANIISEPDKGIYDAMNKGMEQATGDYILFMNAGDMFADAKILSGLTEYCLSTPDFIYGDSQEDGHLKRARHHSKINWGMHTHHQAMLYRRQTLAAMRYDLHYKIAADYDLTLRFLKIAKSVMSIPMPICIFESGGLSQTNVKTGRDEQFESRQNNKSCPLLINHAIRAAQIIRYALRQHMPEIYWHLLRR